ncbi:hypothetical protein [Streptomyces violascens]|uniref:hypothetical protein n=1 Tax=Streptomyces violascens TaxID=67381 RepID=UPI0036BD6576
MNPNLAHRLAALAPTVEAIDAADAELARARTRWAIAMVDFRHRVHHADGHHALRSAGRFAACGLHLTYAWMWFAAVLLAWKPTHTDVDRAGFPYISQRLYERWTHGARLLALATLGAFWSVTTSNGNQTTTAVAALTFGLAVSVTWTWLLVTDRTAYRTAADHNHELRRTDLRFTKNTEGTEGDGSEPNWRA